MDDTISRMQDAKKINFNSLARQICMKSVSESRMASYPTMSFGSFATCETYFGSFMLLEMYLSMIRAKEVEKVLYVSPFGKDEKI